MQEPDQAFDFAVLELERDKLGTSGWFQTGCRFQSQSQAGSGFAPNFGSAADETRETIAFSLNVAGYPADSPHHMWAAFCDNVVFQPGVPAALVQHRCNSFSGFSGG